MPSTINIYPTRDLYHVRTDDTSSAGRNAASSTTTLSNRPELTIASYIDGVGVTYTRTYLEFDVSSLVGNFITGITLYGEYGNIDNIESPAPIVVYSGTGSLDGGDYSQYSLYLDKGEPLGGGLVRQWGELTKPVGKDDPFTFTSTLNLENYSVDPADGIIVVGIVSNNDFSDIYPYDPQREVIYSSEYAGGGVVLPYIEVTYAASLGYANLIMGVTATSVAGVPAANIISIMGV
jgi:hypothetical protein